MATQFDTVAFKVVPQNGRFPNPETDEEGLTTYTCTAYFDSATHRNSFANRLNILNTKRNLGTRTWNVHIDYGVGVKELTIPVSGGHEVTYANALLVSMSNAEGYGRIKSTDYFANLKFIILDRPLI